MVKICWTGLLKLNFETRPKKRIFGFLPKISAGHGWSWKIFFANFQLLGPLGCQGWVVIPQNVKKKSKPLHPTAQCCLELLWENGDVCTIVSTILWRRGETKRFAFSHNSMNPFEREGKWVMAVGSGLWVYREPPPRWETHAATHHTIMQGPGPQMEHQRP